MSAYAYLAGGFYIAVFDDCPARRYAAWLVTKSIKCVKRSQGIAFSPTRNVGIIFRYDVVEALGFA